MDRVRRRLREVQAGPIAGTATVTWPEGEGDTLVGVIGPDQATRFVDYDAPCNNEFHYRVFAVRHGEEGYVVLASSNIDGALRECRNEPPAEPEGAWASTLMQAEGGVKLAWEQCSSEEFVGLQGRPFGDQREPDVPAERRHRADRRHR